MKFTRKGFFKSIFGGIVAATAAPSLVKAEDKASSAQGITINPNGDVGIGETINYQGNGTMGLGTNTPKQVLHVSGIVFHINDRRLEMSGTENGDFKIKWLDVKNDESHPCIMISKPQTNPFRSIPYDT